jgi:hypothetical protein
MYLLVVLAALGLLSPSAPVKISCSGYSRALNDYVEHYGKISATAGEFDGERVAVTTTANAFVLDSAKAQIRINRTTGTWVILGPHGTRPALEWSRGNKERCYFSNKEST